jgi:hypothetical protein
MRITEVTGRDRLLVARALAYAIVSIERLPKEWREATDQRDMKTLLNTFPPKLVKIVMIGARSHLERRSLDRNSSDMKFADRDGEVIPIR